MLHDEYIDSQKYATRCVKFRNVGPLPSAIFFFPGLFFIIFTYFCSFMVVWGLGFWGWGLVLGVWGGGFQLVGFGACGEIGGASCRERV